MNLINALIKFIGIDFCINYSFFKIINYNELTKMKKLIIFLTIVLLSILHALLQSYIPFILRIFLIYFIYSIILGKLAKIPIGNSMITVIVSLALTYILHFISLLIMLILLKFIFTNVTYNDSIILLCSAYINTIFIYRFFKLNRFKNGFPFIKNTSNDGYFDIFILVVNIIIIFMYFFIGSLRNISIIYMTIAIISFSLIMLIILQKTFILYQKNKLQLKTVQEYQRELIEIKSQLNTAIAEKQKLVKSNHEFYHRQEALSKKLDDLMNQQKLKMNTEFGDDLGEISDRINKLSNEYTTQTRTIPKLRKTNIAEIDDMLSYMQSECEKNNIEFILKIDCNVQYMLDNFITKSQLETLLGDLIRNAIIAIGHSSTNYRSIMVVFGIKDESYELCIFDSGIHFEINTLINLGLKPASTHENEGGTGIGFITTFETINSCKASLIINEKINSNYTKSIEIKFDNKDEYIIISDRNQIIKETNKLNRNIILKG